MGIAVWGISPDSVEKQRAFKAKYDLPFTLLSDADHTVAEAYGVWGEKTFAGRKYMGVERSTFLIGPDGGLEQVWPKVTPDGHARQVLEWLAEQVRE